MASENRLWKRFKQVYSAARHVWFLRGLLDWMGWWKPTVAAMISLAVTIGGYFSKHLAWPELIAIGLVIFASVLVIWRASTYPRQQADRVTWDDSVERAISEDPTPLQMEAPTPAPPVPLASHSPGVATKESQSEKRIPVDENITPEYLASFFKDHTSIQAKKLVEPSIGRWIKVSGNLGQVISSDPTFAQVTFTDRGLGSRYLVVFMYFRSEDCIDRLSMMKRGASITVLGQIEKVESIEVHLDNCQLVK